MSNKFTEVSTSDLKELICHQKEMADLLDECRDFISKDPNCGPCGLGLICMIDELIGEKK